MDETVFAVVYSVTFCTALSVAERRGAFLRLQRNGDESKRSLPGMLIGYLTCAVMPAAFFVLALPSFRGHLLGEGPMSTTVALVFCAVPVGSAHIWIIAAKKMRLSIRLTPGEEEPRNALELGIVAILLLPPVGILGAVRWQALRTCLDAPLLHALACIVVLRCVLWSCGSRRADGLADDDRSPSPK